MSKIGTSPPADHDTHRKINAIAMFLVLSCDTVFQYASSRLTIGLHLIIPKGRGDTTTSLQVLVLRDSIPRFVSATRLFPPSASLRKVLGFCILTRFNHALNENIFSRLVIIRKTFVSCVKKDKNIFVRASRVPRIPWPLHIANTISIPLWESTKAVLVASYPVHARG